MDLKAHYNQLTEAGLAIVQVAPSSVEETRAFIADFDLPFAAVADPEGEAFADYGLREGSFIQLGGPKVLARSVQATFTTGRGGAPKGNARMLPGTAVIDAAGRVRLHQAGDHAADHMTANDLLRIAKQIMSLDNATISG